MERHFGDRENMACCSEPYRSLNSTTSSGRGSGSGMAATIDCSSSPYSHSSVEKGTAACLRLRRRQAAVASHLKQPGLERHIPQQDRQGKIELEEDMLEHIRDLFLVFEKA